MDGRLKAVKSPEGCKIDRHREEREKMRSDHLRLVMSFMGTASDVDSLAFSIAGVSASGSIGLILKVPALGVSVNAIQVWRSASFEGDQNRAD